ncbi:hypothetical protein VTK73DRAFT_10252 [Phialemonium thermophilum]|uniref:Uncharacterized protein n=1 Tax=Phialemonium thermophilum TaxID=223376 RepID=A0ABR3VXL1_9PEZI
MAPPCHGFLAAELPQKVQTDVDGKRRKTSDGRAIDLKKCELLGLVQYSCSVDQPDVRDSPVRCWPIQRWFRRCQDRNGSFTVETTAWESGTTAPARSAASPAGSSIDHWTPGWQQHVISTHGSPKPR